MEADELSANTRFLSDWQSSKCTYPEHQRRIWPTYNVRNDGLVPRLASQVQR